MTTARNPPAAGTIDPASGGTTSTRRHPPTIGRTVLYALLPLVLWLVPATFYATSGYRVSPDSIQYLDCARSIADGRGFLTRTYEGLSPAAWGPLRLFPPGYPLLIAPLLACGVAPYHAGMTVTMVCSGLFILLMTAFFLRELHPIIAITLACTIVVMPSFLGISTTCLSDGSFFFLQMLSFYALVRALDGDRNPIKWAALAGIAGGFAWCIRNLAVALAVAEGLCFLFALGWLRPRPAVRAGLAWGAGWALGCGWLVVRNLATFGQLNPYAMPPAEIGFFGNVKRTLIVLLVDLFNPPVSLAGALERIKNESPFRENAPEILLAAALGAIVVGATVSVLYRRLGPPGRAAAHELRGAALLGLYCLVYPAVLIAACTVYRIESIASRYVAPIEWAILFVVVRLAVFFADRLALDPLRFRKGVAVVLGLLFLSLIHTPASWRWHGAGAYSNGREETAGIQPSLPPGALLLSDDPIDIAILRLFVGADARRPPEPALGAAPLTQAALEEAIDRGALRELVVRRREDFLAGRYGDFLERFMQRPEASPLFDGQTQIGELTLYRFRRR